MAVRRDCEEPAVTKTYDLILWSCCSFTSPGTGVIRFVSFHAQRTGETYETYFASRFRLQPAHPPVVLHGFPGIPRYNG
jgi:hypothetical protein